MAGYFAYRPGGSGTLINIAAMQPDGTTLYYEKVVPVFANQDIFPGDGTNGLKVQVSTLPGLASGTNTIGAVSQAGSWTVAATQSGTWTVGVNSLPSLAAGSNAIGSVSVSNFPASQTVSGSISVANLPATQTVSGNISVSNFPSSQAVTGTFWQATQPVSLASVPSHAVTNAGVFVVQATQSGTWTVGLSAGANVIGGVTQSGTWTVTGDDTLARPGWTAKNITTATTTVVKSGAGVLHSIVVNKSVIASTIKIYDNTAGSGTLLGTITYGLALLTDPPLNGIYDIAFSTGLTIVTSAAHDVTVAYR